MAGMCSGGIQEISDIGVLVGNEELLSCVDHVPIIGTRFLRNYSHFDQRRL